MKKFLISLLVVCLCLPYFNMFKTVYGKEIEENISLSIEQNEITILKGNNYGYKLKATVMPQDSKITWSSSDEKIAKVDQSGKVIGVKAGSAIITVKTDKLSAQVKVNVEDTKDKYIVYVYANSSNITDYGFPDLKANSSGWYTIGYFWSTALPEVTDGKTVLSSEVKADLSTIVRHPNNSSIPTEFLLNIVDNYRLLLSNQGANDYVSNGNAYHLDLYAPEASKTYPLVINYLDETTGKLLDKVEAKFSYGSLVEAKWYLKEIKGYSYVSSDNNSLVIDNKDDVINLYYRKNGSLFVNLTDSNVTYDGADHRLEYSITGSLNNVSLADLKAEITYSDENEKQVSECIDAGKYSAKVTGLAKYEHDGNTYDVYYGNGELTISKANINIDVKGNKKTTSYDGETHSVKGYSLDSKHKLFDKNKVSGPAKEASGINSGNYPLGLTASDFSYNDKNVIAKFNVIDGDLVIEKTDLVIEVEVESLNVAYDGKTHSISKLTYKCDNQLYDETKVECLKEHVVSGVNAGNYELVLDASDFKYNDVNLNVSFKVNKGELVIEKTDLVIEVEAESLNVAYDGKTHSISKLTYKCDNQLYDETKVECLKEHSVSGVNAGNYELTLDASDFKYNDANLNVSFKVNKGSLVISPKAISIETESSEKVYDGTALTAGGKVIGLVENETVSLVLTGSQISAGQSANTYKLVFDGSAKEGNYVVENSSVGTLTVYHLIDQIKVKITGGSFVYDGLQHNATVEVTGLTAGYKVEKANSDACLTHVGRSEAGVKELVIVDLEGNDVTDKLNIVYENDVLEVTKALLEVKSLSAEKEYDGTPLKAGYEVTGLINNETVSVNCLAEITYAGEMVNNVEVKFDGSALETDYKLVITEGKLTVNKNSQVIEISAGSLEKEYDGTALSYDSFTFNKEALVNGDQLIVEVSGEITNAGKAVNEIASWKIVNGDKDVSACYEVKCVVGLLTVTPKQVILTSGSAVKNYDGIALTKPEVSAEGFIEGQGAVYNFTGKQLDVGTSDNTFEYELLENTLAQNYVIEVVYGTLMVKPANEHTLTIHYVNENGTKLLKDYIASYPEKSNYSVAVPYLENYRAIEEKVNGIMGNKDIEVTIVYASLTPDNQYVLQINYLFADGKQAAPTVRLSLKVNDPYMVLSPKLTGYQADKIIVEGNMANRNQTITVTYNKLKYNVTVKYLYPDGTLILEKSVNLTSGESYKFDSPIIEGYIAQNGVVEGKVGNEDIIILVDYIEEEIIDPITPLEGNGKWALTNLLLVLVSIALSGLLVLTAIKLPYNKDKYRINKHYLVRIVSLVVTFLAILFFFKTEDITKKMVMVDKYTIKQAVYAVINLITALLAKKRKRKKDEQEEKMEA